MATSGRNITSFLGQLAFALLFPRPYLFLWSTFDCSTDEEIMRTEAQVDDVERESLMVFSVSGMLISHLKFSIDIPPLVAPPCL